ncbi:hypothetical protein WA1_23250 [Scytonema hofmannii PCC 7110]|uniref:Uncharacterized protein n=1 Tax=Scytonema hofmannii PCC 7110 TaxID=128403 RepID=A0A139X8M0_9CYAN|nr:hypothetical protein [Scytonema hofmannii]KYC41037.1 hypothetical protein WA1_23250 [Scytonema hofmannii PCC 7110]
MRKGGYKGKKFYLSPGLSESKVNAIAVNKLANEIKIDILFGNFDETLKKYKPEKLINKVSENSKNFDIDSRFNRLIISRGITSQITIKVYQAAIKYFIFFS